MEETDSVKKPKASSKSSSKTGKRKGKENLGVSAKNPRDTPSDAFKCSQCDQ